jgi:hypothetical protein
MAIVSKQKIKQFKLFIVSPILEKILLTIYIIVIPLLAFHEKFGNNFSDYFLANTLNRNGVIDQLKSIKTLDNMKSWIATEFVPNYFTTEISPNKPIFPIFGFCNKIPIEDCPSTNAKNFDVGCSTINENLEPGTSSSAKTVSSGDYGKYNSSLCFQIPRNYSSISDIHTNLNMTLNGSTIFISMQSIFYNYWDDTLMSYKINFELDGTQKVRNYVYAYDVVDPKVLSSVYYIALYSLFIIQLVFSSLKIMFEFSIMPNRYTFFGHTAHFLLQYFFVFWFALGFGFEENLTSYSESVNKFFIFEDNLSKKRASKIILYLIFLIYPFRVISLLSWNKHLAMPVQFFVAIYRTIPVLSIVILTSITLIFGLSLASYLGFQENVYALRSYAAAILNYPSTSYGRLFNDDNVFIANTRSIYLEIGWIIQTLLFTLILIYIVVIMIDATKRAFSHEFPALLPNEHDLRGKQEELQVKFDRLLKDLTQIFGEKNKDKKSSSSLNSQEKMVIWLEYNVNSSDVDHVLEKLDDSIKIMIFSKPEEVEDFLRYLFRLKPNLLNSQAGSRFRIVVETSFQNERADKTNIEVLLEWLKGVGCRVPFLMFLKGSLEKELYVHFKKKYPSLFACEDRETALKFCRMEEKLDNLILNFEENKNKYIALEDTISDISAQLSSRDLLET